MQYDDFVSFVQERANLPNRAHAVTIIHATLQTLAERIQGDTANNLASQLPPELAAFVHRPAGITGEPFRVDEFTQRIADRANLELDEAVREIRIVLQTLPAAIAEGQINHLWAELPGEYLTLFEETRDAGRPGTIRTPEATT
jgi:uncharacterized protein (DUF2267 family)